MKQIFFFTLITVFYLINVQTAYAQENQGTLKSSQNLSTNEYLEYINKIKSKESNVLEKPEMRNSSTNNTQKKPDREDILNKIAYLKEQNCCEAEIKDLERQLEDK